jgi:hypothetical protein
MATRDLTVRLITKVEGTRDVEAHAQATEKLTRTTKEATTALQQTGAATAGAVRNRFADASREFDRSRGYVAPPSSVTDAGSTAFGLGRLGRIGGPLLGIAGVASTLGSVGSTLSGFAQNAPTGTGEAGARIAKGIAEGLPIIGQFFSGIRQITDYLGGFAQAVVAAQRAIRSNEILGGYQAQRVDVLGAGRQEFEQAQDRLFLAGTRSATARNALRRLTPQALASFRPDVQFGVANEGTGAANRGIFDADTAVEQAQREYQLAQQNYAAQQRSPFLAAAGIGVVFQNVAARRATLRAESARDALRDPSARGREGYDELRAGAVSATARAEIEESKAAGKRVELQRELNSLKQRSNELTDAGVKLAEAESLKKQAALEFDRNKLGLLREQIGAGKAGATAVGASPGSAETLLAYFSLARSGGVQNVPEEGRAALRSNPATAEFIRVQEQALGEANQAWQELRRQLASLPAREGGLPGQADLQTEANRIADAIARGTQAAMIEAAEKAENATAEGARQLGEQIAKGIINGWAKAANETNQKLAADALQRLAAQAGAGGP